MVDEAGTPAILEANGNSDVNLLQVHGGLLADPGAETLWQVRSHLTSLDVERCQAIHSDGASHPARAFQPPCESPSEDFHSGTPPRRDLARDSGDEEPESDDAVVPHNCGPYHEQHSGGRCT